MLIKTIVQVRTKTLVAVGHESANQAAVKDHMQANLLANMDLGGNQREDPLRITGDSSIQMQQFGNSDDPSYQMRGTNESDDAFYSRGPLQVLAKEQPVFTRTLENYTFFHKLSVSM